MGRSRGSVLVLGGTGTVGRAIVDRLQATGFSIRILARSTPVDAHRVKGDVRNLSSLQAAMSGIDTVVNAVGILRENSTQTFHDTHVVGAQNVVLATRNAGVERLIHITGVNVDSASDPLSRSKALAERFVLESRLDFTILRAPMLFGAAGGALDRIRWTLSITRPFVIVPGGGKGRFQPLWIKDLAECVRSCVANGIGAGVAHDLAGPDIWTYVELVKALEVELGVRRIKVNVPSSVIASGATITALLMRRQPWVTATELQQLSADTVVPAGELEHAFGITPLSLRELLTQRKDSGLHR